MCSHQSHHPPRTKQISAWVLISTCHPGCVPSCMLIASVESPPQFTTLFKQCSYVRVWFSRRSQARRGAASYQRQQRPIGPPTRSVDCSRASPLAHQSRVRTRRAVAACVTVPDGSHITCSEAAASRAQLTPAQSVRVLEPAPPPGLASAGLPSVNWRSPYVVLCVRAILSSAFDARAPLPVATWAALPVCLVDW